MSLSTWQVYKYVSTSLSLKIHYLLSNLLIFRSILIAIGSIVAVATLISDM